MSISNDIYIILGGFLESFFFLITLPTTEYIIETK